MSRRRLKLPIRGGFNSGRRSFNALYPQWKIDLETEAQFQLLSDWTSQNNYSREQAYRFIRLNILLAIKHRGRIWVRLNPNCLDPLADL